MVVDDEGGLRDLLRHALVRRPGVDLVAEASDAASALAQAVPSAPDIVILDLQLPDLHGLDLLEHLRECLPRASIVIFSATAERWQADQALARGAVAFVEKRGLDRLLAVIDGLARQLPAVDVVVLPPDASSPGEARRFVRQFCAAHGCEDLIDGASLVVSELVTNAVRHAASAPELRLTLVGHALRIEVADGLLTAPSPRVPTSDEEGGRGLLLIGALTDAWGIEPGLDGKVVWAELSGASDA